jgi:hypothetical protein
MGGGDKKKNQNQAIAVANKSATDEQARASALQTQLQGTHDTISNSVYGAGGSSDLTGAAATNLSQTGGYDPNQLATLRSSIASTGSSEGYGREGYQSLADTGGFTDAQQTDFLQHAVEPTIASYGRNRDELTRRMAINGGYSPGYTSSESRLDRQKNEDIATAGMTGRVNLNNMIQANKLAGLGGLASTQQEINQNKQAGINSGIGLEAGVASGKVAGQDALQRYMDSGVSALNQNDIIQLQNRLQSGNITAADSQMLAQIASQQKSLYDNIMQGVSAVGGAVGGIATGLNT